MRLIFQDLKAYHGFIVYSSSLFDVLKSGFTWSLSNCFSETCSSSLTLMIILDSALDF